jgi:hypothetical protein
VGYYTYYITTGSPVLPFLWKYDSDRPKDGGFRVLGDARQIGGAKRISSQQ